MADVITLGGNYYILASSSIADETTRVLKYGESFTIYDKHGDMRPLGFENHGLYHHGTRHLSRWVLRLSDKTPTLLSSRVEGDNAFLSVDLANPDFQTEQGLWTPPDLLHIGRSIFLWRESHYERVKLVNYGQQPITFTITVQYEADFRDIFEVRGLKREQRGEMLEPHIEPEGIVLRYKGLDGVERCTRIMFPRAPEEVDGAQASFQLTLDPHEEKSFYFRVYCYSDGHAPEAVAYDTALRSFREEHLHQNVEHCQLQTSNEQFNDWINKSTADLHMLITQTPHGPYPYAGIPWFSTVFGRDGIITAMEMLWAFPEVAKGVLKYLAAHQAEEVDEAREAQPGKILHEQRRGEMADLGEIPFGQYYGTVDATPLFVVLAGKYLARTGDEKFIEGIWPNVQRALGWIDEYGDVDGDGFVEYARHGPDGLVQQGWKDSNDSVFHPDGSDAEPPIALCEVQGYVYEARMMAARIAAQLGEPAFAAELRERARDLRAKFQDAFWRRDIGMYALALDGQKRPCDVRTSNAGHCLYSGIASAEHAARMAKVFMSGEFFSGWGVRTLAQGEARYNPMSYHNGSVWPHDSAIVAAGLARYGYKNEAMKIMGGLFDASLFVDLARLPELFCGFPRHQDAGPTLYPVACDPQAWAAAVVYLLLEACLGLSINGAERKVRFTRPVLPPYMRELSIQNLRVGKAFMDLELRRYKDDVSITVTRRTDKIQVVVVK